MVGVTLGVAPIFSSAWAQNGNQQATMLLEMQALRAEIAELRDMVERQQHELQLMQRTAPATSAPQLGYADPNIGPAQSTQPLVGNTPTAQIANAPPTIVQEGQLSNLPQLQTDSIGVNSPGLANPGEGGTETSNAAEAPAPAFAQDQAGFYRPYTANAPAQTESVGAVVIEERILTPNTPPIVPQSSQETPVEERLVVQRGVGFNGAAVSGPSAAQPANNAPVAGVSSGVVAVPNTRQTTLPAGIPQNQNLPRQNIPVPNTPIQSQPAGAAANGQTVSNQVAIQPSQSFPANQTAPQIVAQTAPVAIVAVLSEADYYQQGFDLLKQSKHTQAVDIFKQQISNYPQGDLVDDAHYWIAESMYVNRFLDISKQYFKAIIDNFSQSPRLPDAMLKTAYIEQEQGNQIEARILLQEIIQYHPRSNAAISAKNRLAELE